MLSCPENSDQPSAISRQLFVAASDGGGSKRAAWALSCPVAPPSDRLRSAAA
jgi:hypothetical protein